MQISEKDVFTAINQLRNNPQSVVPLIKEQLSKFQSHTVYRNAQGVRIRTMSGKSAWQDALLSLQRQKPKGPLQWNQSLSTAAQKYKDTIINNPNANPFQIIKKYCSYQGSITFNINESNVQHDINELIAALIVSDGDDKKVARTSIFHPTYREFGCAVGIKQNTIALYMAFAEKVIEEKNSSYKEKQSDSFFGKKSGDNYVKSEQKPIAQKTSETNKSTEETLKQYITRGKQFIVELNKIRKDPKGIIYSLKGQMNKFKQDKKTLVTDYGILSTKEGQIPYDDFISQLQQQYPLPSVRQVQGLTVTALQQLVQMKQQIQKPTSVDILLDRFCQTSQAIRSIKLKDIQGMPIKAMVLRLLLGDGDRKRTARRKMMSPICKVIGCVISKDSLVLNIGETAKDNIDAVEQYIKQLQQEPIIEKNFNVIQQLKKSTERKSHKSSLETMAKFSDKGQRLVVKKVTRSHKQQRKGHLYKISTTVLTYQNGQQEEIIEEDLLH